jgi:hypothetical protein
VDNFEAVVDNLWITFAKNRCSNATPVVTGFIHRISTELSTVEKTPAVAVHPPLFDKYIIVSFGKSVNR